MRILKVVFRGGIILACGLYIAIVGVFWAFGVIIDRYAASDVSYSLYGPEDPGLEFGNGRAVMPGYSLQPAVGVQQ
jgi:hypothetical protein